MKKKAAILAAAVLLCAVWAAGCSETGAKKKAWDASENSIYVADDLSVQSAMVYTSQKENDLYSAEGLAEFAKKQICSYNEEQGAAAEAENTQPTAEVQPDRKSTRLNSSHRCSSYAVCCLKKKKIRNEIDEE